MKFPQWVAAKWKALNYAAKVYIIAVPLAALVLVNPDAIEWLPKDQQDEVMKLAYWVFGSLIVFGQAVIHLVGGSQKTPDSPASGTNPFAPTPDAAKIETKKLAP